MTGLIGAIAGLAGTLLTKHFEAQEKKAAFEMQKEISAANERIAALELQKVKITTEANKEIAENEAETRVSIAAFEHDAEVGKEPDGFISTVRKAIRPYLTIAFSGLFLYWVWYLISPEVAKIYIAAFITAFIELTVAIVLWWFGIRPPQQK
jgi:propanediol dehydratase small subunit